MAGAMAIAGLATQMTAFGSWFQAPWAPELNLSEVHQRVYTVSDVVHSVTSLPPSTSATELKPLCR